VIKMIIKKTFSKEVQDQINRLKDQVNIVGLSGGKDSMATCILMRYLDKRID
jgi:tRNA(Ile)-lysidine synthase TilS/MesJ